MKKLIFLLAVCFNFSLYAQSDSTSQFYEIDSLFSIKEFSNVIQSCSNLLEKDSTNDYIYFVRAKSYVEIGRLYEALIDFNKAISLNNSVVNYYFEKAKFNYYSEYHLSSKSDLDKAISLDSLNPEFYFYRSKINEIQSHHSNALKDIEKSLLLDSTNVEYIFQKAIVLESMERVEESLLLLGLLIEKEVINEEYLFKRGEIYFSLGLFEKSCNDLYHSNKFITTHHIPSFYKNKGNYFISDICDSTNVMYYYLRALHLINNKEVEKSIAMLDLGQKRLNKKVLFPLFKAYLYSENEQFKLMDDEIEKSVSLIFEKKINKTDVNLYSVICDSLIYNHPNNPDLYLIRAKIHFINLDYEWGLVDLNNVLVLDSNRVKDIEQFLRNFTAKGIINEFIREQINEGNYQIARLLCNNGLILSPLDQFIFNYLGYIELGQRNYKKAIFYFEKSNENIAYYDKRQYKYKRLADENQLLRGINHVGLSYCYATLLEYKKAIKFAKKSTYIYENIHQFKVNENLSESYNLIGQLYLALGKYNGAKFNLNEAINQSKNNASAYFNLAILTLQKEKVFEKNVEVYNYEEYFESVKNKSVYVQSEQKIKKKRSIEKAYYYCTKAIKIDENFASAYYLRAQICKLLRLDPCPDAKKAFDLGIYEVYNNLGLDDCQE